MTTSNTSVVNQGHAADGTELAPTIDCKDVRAVLGCIANSRLIFLYRPDIGSPAMWWSPGSARLLGYESEELKPSIGTLNTLVHPHDLPALLARSSAIARELDVGDFACEYRLRRKQGDYLWVRSVTSTCRQPDSGYPTASLEVLRVQEPGRLLDSTALKLSEDALNTVLNEIGYPVVLMDATGLIVQANEAADRLSPAPNLLTGFCPFLHRDDGSLLFPGFLEDVLQHGQPASRELERFDRWWHVHLVPIRNRHHEVARILLLAQDITNIKAKQVVQLEHERALRATLVREVHHRIKNHLQGLIGLLRRTERSKLSGTQQMNSAIAQIHSIASIHGLLARSSNASVNLTSLITEIVNASRATSPIPMHLSHKTTSLPPIELTENESIPLAVAVGELLTNASKHTARSNTAHVTVNLLRLPGCARLTIKNSPARLPSHFRLEDWSGEKSGLALVLTLLSYQHIRLTLGQRSDSVVATLELQTA